MFDGYKELTTTVTRPGMTTGVTTHSYTERGELKRIRATGGTEFTRQLANNREGLITSRREASGKVQNYAYFQGAEVASFGNANKPELSNAYAMTWRSDYVASRPSSYTVNTGDTLASIAQLIWGDSRMWYLIADANGLAVGANDALEVGDTLRIPAVAGSTKNNATTFKPYDPSDIIGNTTPNPKAPPPPKKKCGGLGAIVMVVVAVVAVVVTAGAALAALAPAGSFGAASFSAIGASALTGGTLTAGISGWTVGAAAFIGGAVGSAVSQGVGMAMGVVDKFSWRQVAAGGIGAGLTAGLGHLGHIAKITEGMNWSQAASAYAQNAAMSYSVNQLSGRVAGLDTSFSWRSVASTVVGATVGNAAGHGLGLDGGNLWSGVARSVVTGSSQSYFNQQWARGGKLDFVQLAMDSFGNALGNDIVGRMTPAATAAPVTLAKNGQRAMDMDGVNFLDAGVDTSMPDMRWMDDLNTSIAKGSNLAVNANTPGYTATVSAASQTAVAGGYDGDPGMGTFTEITYNPNEQVMPEVVVTASAKESGGGLLSWLRKPENISFVLDMVPVVGSMKSIYQVFSGKDLITGESVNRWVEGASIVAGMAPAGKLGVKGIVGAVPNKAGTSGWTDLARDARAVVRDVEAHSGVKMSSNQRALLADELRHVDHTYIASRSDYQALQRQYSSQYNNLKREWEFNTGQIWPKTSSGVDFQSHHVIPKQYGGPNQWWNLHPVPGGSAHQGGVHGIGSPTSTAFPQHPPRVR